MKHYSKPKPELWTGRESGKELYLHEKVRCLDIEKLDALSAKAKTAVLLGYACDEGVKRNQGRVGAAAGPDAIRKQLGKMPNHLEADTQFLDIGNVQCSDIDMETAQENLSEKIAELLKNKSFPILLGGGHDIAYGHYNGIKNHLGTVKSIGIVNFDAHFDLRSNADGCNSGTPFFQIAQDCNNDGSAFKYMCLGIRKDANDTVLFQTANDLKVSFVENIDFSMNEAENIVRILLDFIRQVDCIYVTIDLDGFSSAYAPGVSAPSPIGFTPKIVIESLELILKSKKLISLDIAEMNPKYDVDNQTAKLAASLIHFVMHNI